MLAAVGVGSLTAYLNPHHPIVIICSRSIVVICNRCIVVVVIDDIIIIIAAGTLL
jgi:hypothetical protein